MRNYYSRSTHKFEANVLNEDAAMARKTGLPSLTMPGVAVYLQKDGQDTC